MIEADESWARRDHQQQRWLLAGFGHVAGRPFHQRTKQGGKEQSRTVLLVPSAIRSSRLKAQDRVPMCIPGTLRLFSLTHSPRSALCSCSLAAYSAYDYDAATPSLQHQLSFSWLANEKKKSSSCI